MKKFAKKTTLVLAAIFLLPIFAACMAETPDSNISAVVSSVEFPDGTVLLAESTLNEEQQAEVLRIVNEALKSYAGGALPLEAEVSSAVIPQLTHVIPSSAFMPGSTMPELIYLQVYDDDGVPPIQSDGASSEPAPLAGSKQAETRAAKQRINGVLQGEVDSQAGGGSEATPSTNEEWPATTTATLKEASLAASISLSDLYILKVDIAADLLQLVSPAYELVDVSFVDGKQLQVYDTVGVDNGGNFTKMMVSRASVSADFTNVMLAGIVPVLHGRFVLDKNDGYLRIWTEEHGYFCYSVTDGSAFGETRFPILTDINSAGMAGGSERFNYIEVGQLGETMFALIQKTHQALPK